MDQGRRAYSTSLAESLGAKLPVGGAGKNRGCPLGGWGFQMVSPQKKAVKIVKVQVQLRQIRGFSFMVFFSFLSFFFGSFFGFKVCRGEKGSAESWEMCGRWVLSGPLVVAAQIMEQHSRSSISSSSLRTGENAMLTAGSHLVIIFSFEKL